MYIEILMDCPICRCQTSLRFSEVVLQKYKADYYYCGGCGFLFTPTPFWINEAYSDAIPETDTGLVMRNISIAKILVSVFYFLMGQKGQGQYLDVGGGYGLLTRIMRDYGFNFCSSISS